MKEKGIAFILWAACFMGVCGLQRLYLGKIGTGLLYLFTLGLFGIGQLVDLFRLPGMVTDTNNRLLVERAGQAALAGRGRHYALPPRRVPRSSEEFQVALVQAAEKHGGVLTVVEAVSETGRGFKDVQRQLTEMAVNGYIELDSDDEGQAFYRFPGL
jgi:TM2 domain-containing membrane protein YozV